IGDSGFHPGIPLRLERFVFPERALRHRKVGSRIRIQEFGEARILSQVVKIRIVPCLVAQAGIQLESFLQVFEGIFDVSGEAIESGKAVGDEIGFWRLLQQLVDMFAGGNVIPDVHERDSVIIVLFDALELRGGRALEVLVADAEMNGGAVRELFAGAGKHLLKQWLCLFELMFLQSAQPGFVILQRLRDPRILGDGCFFWGSLLSHVKNFSCARRNGEPLVALNSKSEYSSMTQKVGVGQFGDLVPSCEYRATTERLGRVNFSGTRYSLTRLLVDRRSRLQIDLLPFALDDAGANLGCCLAFLVLLIRVVQLFQAGGAAGAVRGLKAAMQAVVAHAVAVAVARLLVYHRWNL